MRFALIIFGVISCVELLLPAANSVRLRKAASGVLGIGLILVNVWLYAINPNFWWLIFTVFTLYRLINLLRIYKGRIPTDYLLRASRRTTIWLAGLQILIICLVALSRHYQLHATLGWYLVLVLQLLLSLMLLGSTMRHLRTTKPPMITRGYVDRDLPTLTIAIPARNETTDLEACLESIVTSNYPKLEILVLDDCSANKHTPEIIRSFAQSGVRFIAGTAPPKHWLAKNFAYQQLAQEANGELVLFCGVDTRFQPDSLRAMVETLLLKKKTMLSVLPKNTPPGPGSFGSLLVQPSRYAWELALPRRLLNRPPVLSTCWLITAASLHKAGGFEAVSRSSSPESYFARDATQHSDGYSFMVSNQAIGLSSTKSYGEQQATAVRTRYPQLHRRIELVALLSLAELASLVLPFIMLPVSLVAEQWTAALMSGVCCFLLVAFYAHIVELTYRKFVLRGLWLLPFATLYDIVLLNNSMWQYEFGEVIWKGRNICIPVMCTSADLTKLGR